MSSDETSGGDSEIMSPNELDSTSPTPFRWPIGRVGHEPAHVLGDDTYLSVECPMLDDKLWFQQYGLWMLEGTRDLYISGAAFAEIFNLYGEWLFSEDWHSSMTPVEWLYTFIEKSTFYPANNEIDWPKIDFLSATFAELAEGYSDLYDMDGDYIDMKQVRNILPVVIIPGFSIPYYAIEHTGHLHNLMKDDLLIQARFEPRCYDNTIYYTSAVLEVR